MTVSSDANRRTIADDYRQMIVSGELPDGAPLPPVVDIAEQYGVSKDVVTRAFRLLQADGLIRVGRRGALVSAGEVLLTHQSRPRPGTRLVPASNHVQVIAAGFAPAPEHVAVELGIEPLAAAVRRVHVHRQGRLPVGYAVSWVRAELLKTIPELVEPNSARSTDELLSESAGHAPVSGVDEICARGASVEVARELGISEGAPVLAGYARRLDGAGTVVEFREFFVPADRRLGFAYFL